MLAKLAYLARNPRLLLSAMRRRKDANVDRYIRHAPHPQNAIAIFNGQWWSQLPPEYGVVAGRLPLFWDSRITWAIEAMGGVEGKSVLELGPLEGGHTYVLEKAGARSVLAVEGDANSYLRCLIAKEIVQLHRSRFVLGDFEEYLRAAPERFDVAIASGVLYHVRHPVELIHNLARVADQLYLWTHYFDRERLKANQHMAHRFSHSEQAQYQGFAYTAHRYDYGDFLQTPRFAGGSSQFANWLSREELLGALRHAGLTEIKIHEDDTEHVNGPAISLAAWRPGSARTPSAPPEAAR